MSIATVYRVCGSLILMSLAFHFYFFYVVILRVKILINEKKIIHFDELHLEKSFRMIAKTIYYTKSPLKCRREVLAVMTLLLHEKKNNSLILSLKKINQIFIGITT